MRTLALVTGDFRTADSGARLRDYYMCSALSQLGDLDVIAFVPHQDVAGPKRELTGNVMVDRARVRPLTLVASILQGDLYHGRVFDPRDHKDFSEISTQKYDVIFSSMVYGVPAASMLRGGSSPDAIVVWDSHNYDPDVWSLMAANAGPIRRFIARRQVGPAVNAVTAAASMSDIVLACTDDDAAKLERLAPRSVYVVPNGGEMAEWSRASRTTSPEPRSCVIFGTLRQNSTRRGIEWFLERVWPGVLERSAGATLTVAGRDAASALVRRISRAPGVHLVANPPDLAGEVTKAQLIAIPQATGTGSKIKVFEAIATGRPIVASPSAVVGISPDLVAHIAVLEDPAGWIGAIVRSFDDPQQTPDDSPARRAVVEGSEWSTSSEQLLTILRERVARLE
jgi:glycosyltransferase involved in cell wall biosynthesis